MRQDTVAIKNWMQPRIYARYKKIWNLLSWNKLCIEAQTVQWAKYFGETKANLIVFQYTTGRFYNDPSILKALHDICELQQLTLKVLPYWEREKLALESYEGIHETSSELQSYEIGNVNTNHWLFKNIKWIVISQT